MLLIGTCFNFGSYLAYEIQRFSRFYLKTWMSFPEIVDAGNVETMAVFITNSPNWQYFILLISGGH